MTQVSGDRSCHAERDSPLKAKQKKAIKPQTNRLGKFGPLLRCMSSVLAHAAWVCSCWGWMMHHLVFGKAWCAPAIPGCVCQVLLTSLPQGKNLGPPGHQAVGRARSCHCLCWRSENGCCMKLEDIVIHLHPHSLLSAQGWLRGKVMPAPGCSSFLFSRKHQILVLGLAWALPCHEAATGKVPAMAGEVSSSQAAATTPPWGLHRHWLPLNAQLRSTLLGFKTYNILYCLLDNQSEE